MEIALSSYEYRSIEICSGRKLSDLEYPDDVFRPSEHPNMLQVFFHGLQCV